MPGLDGFTSLFFQHFWEIVRDDVVTTVEIFFGGSPMP